MNSRAWKKTKKKSDQEFVLQYWYRGSGAYSLLLPERPRLELGMKATLATEGQGTQPTALAILPLAQTASDF